jgi:hypothetical protein
VTVSTVVVQVGQDDVPDASGQEGKQRALESDVVARCQLPRCAAFLDEVLRDSSPEDVAVVHKLQKAKVFVVRERKCYWLLFVVAVSIHAHTHLIRGATIQTIQTIKSTCITKVLLKSTYITVEKNKCTLRALL